MCMMTACMHMLSLHSATVCGGSGVIITHGVGDGTHLGITLGMVRDIGTVVIGVDGIIIIGILLIITTIIIRITDGVE